jgi:hypothetical protein
MSVRTIILSNEVDIAPGIGNSSNVSNATVVRIFNTSGGQLTIHVSDPSNTNEYSGIGSISMPSNHIEYIEKPGTYTVWGSANFKATKVGYTG